MQISLILNTNSLMGIKLFEHALQEKFLQVLQEKFKQHTEESQKHWQNSLWFQVWKGGS